MKKVSIKKAKALIILIGLVFLAIGCYLSLNKEKVQDEQNETIIEIDINDELIQKVYQKIPRGDFDYDRFIYFSTYKSTKQTYKTLSNQFIMESALYYITYYDFTPEYIPGDEMTNTAYKLPFSKIEEKMKDIFGEIDFDVEKYNSSVGITSQRTKNIGPLRLNALTSDQYVDNEYYFYEYYDGTNFLSSKSFNQLLKAEQAGDYLYLYDKHLNVVSSDEKPNQIFEIYFDEINKASVTLSKDEFYNLDGSLKGLENSKNIKSNIFKHTFKRTKDGNYIWVSTEIYEK